MQLISGGRVTNGSNNGNITLQNDFIAANKKCHCGVMSRFDS